MFDDILYQPVTDLLSSDIDCDSLPQSILFYGPSSSGKYTCALEIARMFCSDSDILVTGYRDCSLEIEATKETFLQAIATQKGIEDSFFLFFKRIRKLTSRFNPVLWNDDDKVSKVTVLVSSIDEIIEEIQALLKSGSESNIKKIEKKVNSLCDKAQKLQSSFMTVSLPIAQMRRAAAWARYTVSEGKKALIIENVDRMQESVRNALLKILEEPPKDTLFILTTTRRGVVMPTILSRVRSYSFIERTKEQQCAVIRRAFFVNFSSPMSIDDYLTSFLPVEPQRIEEVAQQFLQDIRERRPPSCESIVKEFKNFEPKMVLSLFFDAILNSHEQTLRSIDDAFSCAKWQESGFLLVKTLKNAYNNITIYNQSPTSALEAIVYSFLEGGLL